MHKCDRTDLELDKLIESGIVGHLPFLDHNWPKNFNVDLPPENYKCEKEMVKKILMRLKQHKKWDRKRSILSCLSEAEKCIFMKHFIKKVEDKMKKDGINLH